MYILVAFLAIGLICNLAVRPVKPSLFTLPAPAPVAARSSNRGSADPPAGEWGLVAFGWLLAGAPIGWGVFRTLTLVGQMFR
jgi:hypothetical protein